jgi:ferredoxin
MAEQDTMTDSSNVKADEPAGLRLYVDEALCSAHGLCAAAAPSLFKLDDDGFNTAAGAGWVPLTEDQAEIALSAERACPEAAIRVLR